MAKIEITEEKYIYKYFTVNEFLLKTLINNELYFASPFEFNDPFDCQFNVELVKSSPAEKQFHENLILNGIPIDKVCSLNLENETQNVLEDKINTEMGKILGVTCFSEKPDEILMWSHYADSHKGICLKFDWKVHPEFFKGEKVIYDNSLPTIRYIDGQHLLDEVVEAIMVKLEMWSYENEIRSVIELKTDERRTPSFNPAALAGVIFGEKVTEDNIQVIKRIINLHGEYRNVDFLKAKLNRRESKIEITPYNNAYTK